MNNTTPKVYLARAGGNGDEAYALDHGVAIIGFSEYPSLVAAKDYDAILALVKAAKPDLKPRAAGNCAGQLWAFALAMQPGDLVVLPRKLTSQMALGRVTGPYKYEKVDGVSRHTRAVEWASGRRPLGVRAGFAPLLRRVHDRLQHHAPHSVPARDLTLSAMPSKACHLTREKAARFSVPSTSPLEHWLKCSTLHTGLCLG